MKHINPKAATEIRKQRVTANQPTKEIKLNPKNHLSFLTNVIQQRRRDVTSMTKLGKIMTSILVRLSPLLAF